MAGKNAKKIVTTMAMQKKLQNAAIETECPADIPLASNANGRGKVMNRLENEFESTEESIIRLMEICSIKIHQAHLQLDPDTATAFYARRLELAAELRSLRKSQSSHIAALRSNYELLVNDYSQDQRTRGSVFEMETLARYGRQMALAC